MKFAVNLFPRCKFWSTLCLANGLAQILIAIVPQMLDSGSISFKLISDEF